MAVSAAGQGTCARLPGEICVCSVRRMRPLGAEGEILVCHEAKAGRIRRAVFFYAEILRFSSKTAAKHQPTPTQNSNQKAGLFYAD